MISRYFILLCLLSLPSLRLDARVQAGIRGGVNFSRLMYTSPEYSGISGSRSGFHGGLYASVPLFRNAFLSPELLFSQHGMSRKDMDFRGGIQVSGVTLNYLELPVLFSYKIFKGLHAEAGPDIALLISSKDHSKNIPAGDQTFHRMDLGLNAGLRFHILRRLFLTARYRAGILSAAEIRTPPAGPVLPPHARHYNRSWMAGIGFALK